MYIHIKQMAQNLFGWQVLRTCTYRLPGCRYIEACWAYSYCAPRHADNYKLYPSQSSMHMLRVLKGKESLKHLSTSMIKKLGCKNRVCPGTSRATSKIKKQFSRESSIHKKKRAIYSVKGLDETTQVLAQWLTTLDT